MGRGQLTIISHPLALDKMRQLRNKNTEPESFRRIVGELSKILACEITRDLPTVHAAVMTPIARAKCVKIAKPVVLVPILRAGQAMLDGMLDIMPFAKVGHIGIYRAKSGHNPVEYYYRMPTMAKGSRVVVLDPMLATGDTAAAAIAKLKQNKVGAITFVCLLAATKGIEKLKKEHPDIHIYAVNVDKKLTANGYITPGLGDAGDRIFGTR